MTEPPVVEDPLTLSPIGELSIDLGSSLEVTLTASGANSEDVSYDVAPLPLPNNASLDPQTGVFKFTPEVDQVGSYTFIFTVTDGSVSDSESVPLAVAEPDPDGITELTGRVLDANAFEAGESVPLSGVVVSMLATEVSATTDEDGNFKLTGIPDGVQVLDLNAENATSSANTGYAGFRESIELIANVNNDVTRPFFLPQLEQESLTVVDPSLTTIVANDRLGVRLTVPPGTARDAQGDFFTGSLSISEVPAELAPAPLPPAFRPGLLITIQPVGVRFDNPVPITFPNIDQLTAGSEINIWSIDPDSGTFIVVGVGRVNEDESAIETVSGGIIAADWHFPSPNNPDGSTNNDDQSNDNDGNNDDCGVGSGASISGGCLKISHALATYDSLAESRGLRFTYTSESAAPFPVTTVETSLDNQTAVPVAFRAKLTSVGGILLGDNQFVTPSREPMRHAIQFDASRYPTGQYPYEFDVSSEYLETGISTILKDFVLVNNEMNSPFGAGWTLDGLQRLHTVAGNERVTLSEGDGSIKTFIPQGAVGEQPSDLAFLIDGSGSINSSDFSLQLEGLAAALESPLIIPYDGSVSILVVQFANGTATTEVELTNIDSENVALDVAALIRAISQRSGSTPIAAAVNLAVEELTMNGRDGARQIIVVSTDGQPNSTSAALQAANNAVVSGIDEISGIGVGPGANLQFLDDFVRNGSVFSAANFSQFAANVGENLRIIVGGSPSGEFSFVTKRDDGTFVRQMTTGERVLFDDAGYQTSMIDRNGNETSYEYDAANRLVRIVDPVGLITDLSYENGTLATVTDPAGRVTQFNHSGGNLTSITDPDGTSRSFAYDGHLLISQTDKKNQVTGYVYDFENRFISSTRPDNTTRELIPSKTTALVDVDTTFDQPAQGTLVSESVSSYSDGNGEITRFLTDKLGNISETVDALGRVTTMERDENGLVTRLQEPNGNVTEFRYDNRGNMLETTRLFDGAVISVTYDPEFSLPLTVTDARGNTTTIERDSRGNVAQVTNALGHKTSMSHDEKGLPIQLISSNGLTVDYEYNTQGLLITMTETPPPNGGLTRITRYDYDAFGNVSQSISPEGVTVNYIYDELNRITEASNQQGESVRYTYDPHGNQTVIEAFDPDSTLVSQIEADFDALHRVNVVSRPHQASNDSVIEISRDGDGNVVAQSDPNLDVIQYVYNSVNKVIQDIDALGGVTDYQYNDNDILTQVAAPNGATTQFTIDLLNRTTSEISPDRGNVDYTYDLNHNIIRFTDGRNISAIYSYDVLNRVTNITYPDASENVTFVYDSCAFGIGRICERRDESGLYRYVYDVYGNVLEENYTIAGTDYSILYSYNSDHFVSTMTYPGGRVVDYARDSLNRVSDVSATVGGQNELIVSNVSYRADGAIDGLTYGNGLVESRTLDLQSRMTQQEVAGVDVFTYTYDPDSNLTEKVSNANSNVYGYDSLDRVVSDELNSVSSTFTYDPNDNRTAEVTGNGTISYTIGSGNNRIEQSGLATVTYDSTGNTTVDLQGRQLTYNNVGRLDSISDVNELVAEYLYDGTGLRRVKTTAGGVVVYHYSRSGKLVAETSAAGDTLTDYIRMLGQACAQIEVEGSLDEVTYLHHDHLYTPRLGTDSSSNLVWRWDSGAFGSTLPTGEVTVNLRFPGQYYDEESGLHYNYFRYYDPSTGRYITSDPIGLGGGLNTYGYVGGNPMSGIDPYGLDCVAAGGSVTCTAPGGGPTVTFPRPNDWPGTINSDSSNYHSYNIPVPINGADAACVKQGVINSPTPGSPSPATPNGTSNNATPTTAQNVFNAIDWISSFGNDSGGYNNSPVISYTMDNGNTVVNVTQPGHPLHPGYVARTTNGSMVNNYGEGTGFLQGPYSPVAGQINGVWNSQTQNIIDSCGCQ